MVVCGQLVPFDFVPSTYGIAARRPSIYVSLLRLACCELAVELTLNKYVWSLLTATTQVMFLLRLVGLCMQPDNKPEQTSCQALYRVWTWL